ncbi:response regulator transcription factor [Rhizobium lusitanum]|uniref:DNA-binding NarL/FixJ family response regulator n=1 Tax=Rhizobium lusitanum TaxID=293958 RepID=A0A7X0IPP6_9HYPH|nr:response regulator transcription factor [Rhizobium lusitanum]MBB6484790.1 DNA-binding NarL/FixJ family response regulator [Rhizobium lusitanum]
MSRILSVMIADDHAIVREGLKLLISTIENVSVVGEAANGEALLGLLHDARADVLLLDLGMPGVAGIHFISAIKEVASRMKIVVLTANIERRTVRAALDAGASGYLTKDGDPEEIAAAIEAVRRGGTYLAKSIRFAVDQPDRPSKAPATEEIVSPIPLTLRERQILLLSAQGQTARQMAERLGISILTARKHRENLMRKLDLHSSAEVTAYAVRLGMPAG